MEEHGSGQTVERRRQRASWVLFAAVALTAATLAVTLPPPSPQGRAAGAASGRPHGRPAGEVPYSEGGALRASLTPALSRPGSAWFAPESLAIADYQYLADPELPIFNLELPPESRTEIDRLVKELMSRATPVMTEADRLWFPATFRETVREGERTFKVDVRLRGDLAIHWGGTFKSWRVRFPKDDLFHGVRSLNFIVMSDRAYYAEALAFHLARCAGALTFRDGFCRLSTDGGAPQAYYMAEAPTPEFLEAAKRPASAIFRSRDLAFEYLTYRGKLEEQAGDPFSPEFFENYISNPERDGAYNAALAAMFQCRTHTELSQLLDERKYAVGEAITMVFGARHCLGSNNVYYYFDDTVGRFEPILWDVNLFPLSDALPRGLERGPRGGLRQLERIFIADARHRFLRNRILWDWVADDGQAVLAAYDYLHACVGPWLDESVRARDEQRIAAGRATLAGNLSALARELRYTRTFVSSGLSEPRDPHAVHTLRVRNGSFAPVAIEEILIDGRLATTSAMPVLYWDRNRDGLLDARDPVVGRAEALPHVQRLRIRVDPPVWVYNLLNDSLVTMPDEERLFFSGGAFDTRPGRIHYALRNCVTGEELGRDDIWEAVIGTTAMASAFGETGGRAGFLARHPLFVPDAADTACVRLTAGTYAVDEDIIIPRGLSVVIDPGVELCFGPGASLISHGPVTAHGTPAAPISLHAALGDEPWGVLAVVGPMETESSFRHVELSGYSEESCAGAYFSGGLSVYGCPVRVEACSFERGRGEDAMNLKNARGEVRLCAFRNNPSDAIDFDWCAADVVACRFEDNAGDALDVSGSRVRLLHSLIRRSGDKGVSVGERSHALVCDCRIESCSLGVAVKDLSQARIVSTTLAGNDAAVACYQKKALFGGGSAELDYCIVRDNGLVQACDPQSTCRMENCQTQDRPLDSIGRHLLAESLTGQSIPDRELPVGYIGLAEVAR
jgi:hypothetical protein